LCFWNDIKMPKIPWKQTRVNCGIDFKRFLTSTSGSHPTNGATSNNVTRSRFLRVVKWGSIFSFDAFDSSKESSLIVVGRRWISSDKIVTNVPCSDNDLRLVSFDKLTISSVEYLMLDADNLFSCSGFGGNLKTPRIFKLVTFANLLKTASASLVTYRSDKFLTWGNSQVSLRSEDLCMTPSSNRVKYLQFARRSISSNFAANSFNRSNWVNPNTFSSMVCPLICRLFKFVGRSMRCWSRSLFFTMQSNCVKYLKLVICSNSDGRQFTYNDRKPVSFFNR